MTHTSVTKMVEVEEHTHTCDFCDFTVVGTNHWIKGITSCSVCLKDICRKHTAWYQEDPSGDFYDARVCPDCRARFDEAWKWADANAGRHDSLMDIVRARLADNGTAGTNENAR